MADVLTALATAGPIYNMAIVLIVLFLFQRVFATAPKNAFMKPWKLLLVAVIIFIVEELFTVLRNAGVVVFREHVNGFFELVIISIFIYMLLLQRQHLKH
ncbi:hypothetical protein HY642_04755 [Candidatus Woesearchaeota archaeon]|nr:hypothetical protein [Candidatus Woesearchaeota archaeon]